MIQAGERFGNYEVVTSSDGSPEVLGSGAGGVTYRGRHIHLGSAVAIKVLLQRKNLRQADRDAFLSEARAAASLTHPQIARILDFGESASKHPYYVMEVCEGGSLEGFVERFGRPGEDACVQWLFEAASALAHAHRNGILHRDIKPSNLLVSHENGAAIVKLIDFGLAERSNPDANSGQVIGTPHFAAPEQLRGEAQTASDVFSLGASFLWLLSGRNLSHGDVKAVIAERLDSTGYSALLSDLPQPWQTLLARMLDPDPGQRPHDGGEVLAAIREIFPQHAPQPVPWMEDAAGLISSSDEVEASRWQEFPETSWEDRWQITGAPVKLEHGESMRAKRTGDPCEFEVLRSPHLPDDVAAVLVQQGDLVAKHAVEFGLGEVVLERGPDWYCIAWPVIEADDALSWVRQGHDCTLAQILGALDPIANGLDGIMKGGFESMELHPAMFSVMPGPPLAFSLALPLPVVSTDDETAGSASTMRGALGAGLGARFASCVYQFLSGRTLAPAAFVNARAYQAIPKLSERSNRFLATAIAGGDAGSSCRDIIRGLAHEERIPGATLSGGLSLTSASSNRSGAARSSSVVSNAPTAPGRPSLAPAGPPAPQAAVPASPELPSAPPPSSIPLPPQADARAARQPPVGEGKDASSAAAKTSSSRNSKNTLIAVAALAAVLVVAPVSWFAYARLKPSSQGEAPSPQSEDPNQITKDEGTEPPVAPVAPVAPGAKLQIVKVPGDASTLAEAIERCKDGGSVLLTGGTHTQPVVVSKSITIDGQGAAVLEDDGAGTSLVTIRGAIRVKLSNIQIKGGRSDANAPVDSSPALVLATGGASVEFDGCVVESSLGMGLSIVDRATAKFSNCRIRNNRGNGIHLSGGAKAQITLSEIHQNGGSGIVAINPDTEATLHRGTTISANSRHGVELGNGAVLHASGSEFKGNQQTGVIIESGGSIAHLNSSCVVSGNKLYGIGVRNLGKLVMSESIVEDNSKNGIFVEAGGQAEVVSSRISSNGTIGIYLVGGRDSSVSITSSTIQSHAEAGVVFIEGSGVVAQNKFENNPLAIYFGEGSRGSASSNTFNKGPIHDMLLIETNETITQHENQIIQNP